MMAWNTRLLETLACTGERKRLQINSMGNWIDE